jgi:hypothetical protein
MRRAEHVNPAAELVRGARPAAPPVRNHEVTARRTRPKQSATSPSRTGAQFASLPRPRFPDSTRPADRVVLQELPHYRVLSAAAPDNHHVMGGCPRRSSDNGRVRASGNTRAEVASRADRMSATPVRGSHW